MVECNHDLKELFRRPVYEGGRRLERMEQVFLECSKCGHRTLNLQFVRFGPLRLEEALELTDYAEAMSGLPLNTPGPLPPITEREATNYAKLLAEQIVPSLRKDYIIPDDDVIEIMRLYRSRWIHKEEVPFLLRTRAIYQRLNPRRGCL